MSRYIDAELLKDTFNASLNIGDETFDINAICECIDFQPLADVEPKTKWILCSVRLPENEIEVELSIERHANGKVYKFTCRGIHEDGKMLTENSRFDWDDNDFEYSEENDSCLIPEGWYECSRYCEEFGVIDDFVIAWMPLPKPFKEKEEKTNE